MTYPVLLLLLGLSLPFASIIPVLLDFDLTPAVSVSGLHLEVHRCQLLQSLKTLLWTLFHRLLLGWAKALPLFRCCSQRNLSSVYLWAVWFSCSQAPHCLPLLSPTQMLYHAGLRAVGGFSSHACSFSFLRIPLINLVSL